MNSKKLGRILIITGSVIIGLYFLAALTFVFHFFPNTYVNEVNVSFGRPSIIEEEMRHKVETYTLVVQGKDGTIDGLLGSEISLTYQLDGQFQEVLQSQNALLWPTSLFRSFVYTKPIPLEFDEVKLQQILSGFEVFHSRGKVDSISATPYFDGDEFVIQEEKIGTRIDREAFVIEAKQQILQLAPMLNLEEKNLYLRPRFEATSPELIQAVSQLNEYTSASINYQIKNNNTVIDRNITNEWVSFDEDLNVFFHEDMAIAFIHGFFDPYNTYGTPRLLPSVEGKEVKVNCFGQGYEIDVEKEADIFLNAIKTGDQLTRTPNFIREPDEKVLAFLGDTFIQVDRSSQHLWYISDGVVLLESPIVTGLPSRSSTPLGLFQIQFMQRNRTLIGAPDPVTGQPIYRTPVSYWMRITSGGVGLHDATWQPWFGGSRYRTHGSHGCINMPFSKAQALYGMVEVGTPVIVHR